MNFLPDVYVQCEVCAGKRYNQETLAVRFKDRSIADLLETSVTDALPILADIPAIRQKLQTLEDVGLGYIKLGQSAVTLSGGEAQRMKLAKELSKRQTGRTLYLLDEPTTGLHFDDVRFRPVETDPPQPVELYAAWRSDNDNPALAPFLDLLRPAAGPEEMDSLETELEPD